MSDISPAAVLIDADGHIVGLVLDGSIYRLQTQAKIVKANGDQINPATEDTLALIKAKTDSIPTDPAKESGKLTSLETILTAIRDTAGIKKIVDALPIGDNRIGRVKLTDDSYVAGIDPVGALYVGGKSAVGAAPTSNPVAISGTDVSGYKRHLRTDEEGRLQIIAATVPGLAASMINLFYRQTIGAIVAGSFRRVITYVVPTGYSGYLIRFTTWQNEAANSRIVMEKDMGSLEFTTNVFTAGSGYTAPQYAGVEELEVTTTLGAANNVDVTITYTNDEGTSGRTATASIPKSTIVGARIIPTLQGSDHGMRSIQSMSVSPSGGAGAVKALGMIILSGHADLSATLQLETLYAPSAVSFPSGTVLGVEFMGGVVAKERLLCSLVQLVA